METVKDRLLQFLKAENVTKAEFARRMGLSETYVSTMRKSLPEERVLKMTELYPNLNRNWLLYGEGDMYLSSKKESADDFGDADQYFVPLLPVEAYAGSLQAYSRGVERRECSRMAVPVKGADFAIPISGDSMEPVIHNGSIVAVCRINERAFIPWGNPLVIDTENGVYVKVVQPSDKGDNYIDAISYNPRYKAFPIPKESIYGLYRIVCQMQHITTM